MLPIELAAAMMFDEKHQLLPQDPIDFNSYSFGHIWEHNVVVTCLPVGQLGISPATAVATQMKSSFPSIQFDIMVGLVAASQVQKQTYGLVML